MKILKIGLVMAIVFGFGASLAQADQICTPAYEWEICPINWECYGYFVECGQYCFDTVTGQGTRTGGC